MKTGQVGIRLVSRMPRTGLDESAEGRAAEGVVLQGKKRVARKETTANLGRKNKMNKSRASSNSTEPCAAGTCSSR